MNIGLFPISNSVSPTVAAPGNEQWVFIQKKKFALNVLYDPNSTTLAIYMEKTTLA
jgi:hypothetical protein